MRILLVEDDELIAEAVVKALSSQHYVIDVATDGQEGRELLETFAYDLLWDNPLIYTNPAFWRLTGYQLDEVVGRNCRFLQGADTNPQAIAQIRRAIAERKEFKTTLLNYRKDGQPFWNELRIASVFSDEGDLLYFVGIQTDINDRRVVERMKDEFVSVVSHELRTPLTSIRGALGLLAMGWICRSRLAPAS